MSPKPHCKAVFFCAHLLVPFPPVPSHTSPSPSAPIPPHLIPTLPNALAAFEKGPLALADSLLGNYLDQHPGDPAALNLRGKLALAFNRPDLALLAFDAALTANRGFKPAQKNRQAAVPLAQDFAPAAAELAAQAALTFTSSFAPNHPWRALLVPSTKYLLILPWQQGFFAELDHVLGALAIAHLSGRVPIIHWGPGSLFRDEATANAWDTLFEPISAGSIEEARACFNHSPTSPNTPTSPCFPPRWNADSITKAPRSPLAPPFSHMTGLHFLNRPEALCVADFRTSLGNVVGWIPPGHPMSNLAAADLFRTLYDYHIKPQSEILQAADTFARETLQTHTRPILAIHARGSDKIHEYGNLEDLNAAYHPHIAQFLTQNPAGALFLLTDSAPLLADYIRRYPGRLISAPAQRSPDSIGVHFKPVESKRALGREVLLDALIATRCQQFLGTGASNVSCAISYMKDWRASATLIGPPQHIRRY